MIGWHAAPPSLSCARLQARSGQPYPVSYIIDSKTVQAIFTVPLPDGTFQEPVLSYLRGVGARRQILLLAFAPKAAGTFFREAAIRVLNGQLIRLAHAQGGRDGTLYLPNVLTCYMDPTAPDTIAHVHMQALPANRNFIDAFGLKPIIMIRNIADMLASFLDMLDMDPIARADGLNCQVPEDFLEWDPVRKADFTIDVIAPWYASYFATWKTFVDEAPDTVCVLRYRDFCRDPVDILWTALAHADFVVSHADCQKALGAVWEDRASHRFNKGLPGRGKSYFSPAQLARLRRLLTYYPQLDAWLPDLLDDGAGKAAGPASLRRQSSARPPSTMISAPST